MTLKLVVYEKRLYTKVRILGREKVVPSGIEVRYEVVPESSLSIFKLYLKDKGYKIRYMKDYRDVKDPRAIKARNSLDPKKLKEVVR